MFRPSTLLSNRALATLAVALTLGAGAAHAQDDYPTHPITLNVGWAPGGVVDIAARLLAESLSAQWGQRVVVTNTPGAGGVINAGQAALSEPDGYTLVVASSSEITSNRYVQENWVPHYDEDFVPVALLSLNPSVLVVHGESGLDDLEDVLEAARAEPGALAISTTGIGSASHLGSVLFAETADVELNYVPYPGGAPAATAVAGGETTLGVLAVSSALAHVEAGNVRVIGLLSPERVDLVPDWPTLAEAGLDDFEYGVWSALYARAGTPEPVLEKLREGVSAFLADPEVQAKLATAGAQIAPAISETDLVALIEHDKSRDAEIVATAGIVAR